MSARKDKPVVVAMEPAPPASIPAAVVWLVCGYLLLLPLADLLLHWGSALVGGMEITRDRARFAVINALTLTGFQTSRPVDGYAPAGQFIFLLLMLAGSLLPMIVGGLAMVRVLRLPYSDRRIAQSACLASSLAAVIGAIPLIGDGQPPLDAFFASTSAFANCGLYVGQLPRVWDWQTHLVLMPLAVLGGLGLPVLLELYDAVFHRRSISTHARSVLGMTAGVYLAVFILSLAAFWLETEGDGASVRAAGQVSVAAVNCRTAGFPFQMAAGFPRTMQWLLVCAMIIGGGSAGTAGGLKVTTLAAVFRGAVMAMRGQSPGRPFGIALAWLGLYLGLAMVGFLLLLALVPQQPVDRLLFMAISALSNVGLSHEAILIVGPGLDVLSAMMLLGRLVPLAVLWWMARTTRDAELAVAG